MLAIDRGGGADLRPLAKGHSLVLVLDVGMGGDLHIIQIQGLEHDYALTGQGRSVQGIGQLHRALGSFRGKLYLSGDLGLFLTLAHQ